MRGLLAALLMTLLHVPATAEAPKITRSGCPADHLAAHAAASGNDQLSPPMLCGSRARRHRKLSASPLWHRSSVATRAPSSSSATRPTRRKPPVKKCCLSALAAQSTYMGDAVATSPTATVDAENNRLMLTGTKNAPFC